MTEPIVSWRSKGLLIGILLLVNSAAIWGQAGWALDHIVPAGWDWRAGLALALGFAAALELIGVFLATMADEAEARRQPAGGIRLGSYAVGLVSGGLNVSHWGVWTSAAFAFGFLSAVSPFLWGIYSRVRRGEPIAPSRRFWHPIAAVRLIRFMAWRGLTDELAAIDAIAAADAAVAQSAPEPVRVLLPAAPVFLPPVSAPPADADEPEFGAAEPDDRAGLKVRQDGRATQEIETAVRAMRAADPGASQRKIAAAVLVSPSTVRRILAPPEKVNGNVPDLEGAQR
jgi:hypothetical protein